MIEYSIKEYTSDDMLPVAQFTLANKQWPKKTLPDLTSYYRWKFLKNPLGRGIILTANCKGRMIGCVSATFRPVVLTGGRAKCAELGDILVDTGFRRKGIFSRLTKELCDLLFSQGLPFIYVRPNNRSFPILLKLGFVDLFKIRTYFKLLDTENYLRLRSRAGQISVFGIPLCSRKH